MRKESYLLLTVFIALGIFFKFAVVPYVELTTKVESNNTSGINSGNKVEKDDAKDKTKDVATPEIAELYTPELYVKITGVTLQDALLALKWRARGTDSYNDRASICLYGLDSDGKVIKTLNNKGKSAIMGDMSACGYSSGGDIIPLYLGDVLVSNENAEFDLSLMSSKFETKPDSYAIEMLVLDGRTGTSEWAGLIASDVYDEVLVVE